MDIKTGPIKPDEVVALKCATFPKEVFEAFNELIVAKYDDNNRFAITQDDVVALMIAKGLKREEIFRNGWLNIERVYRSAGWEVQYDKPAIGETYDAMFIFNKKK